MGTPTGTHFQLGHVPARLRAKQVGEMLGFEEHEIPILVAKKMLKPLGKPVPNAQKYFAAAIIEQLSRNSEWLDKATQTLYSYWKTKNNKRSNSESSFAEQGEHTLTA